MAVLIGLLFYWDLKRRGVLDEYRERFIPRSCRAGLVKLNSHLPGPEWRALCDKNTMIVTVTSQAGNAPKNLEHYKMYMYREMANALSYIAKTAPDDNLEKTDWVKLEYKHAGNQIDAVTKGSALVKLKTLRDPGLISEHLKNSVNVKEAIKAP